MKYNRVILLCLMIPVILCAQPRGEMGGRFQRPMERLESFKKVRMIEALKLDEETGLKLVKRYSKHRESVKEIEENRAALIDKLDTQVQANAGDGELQKSFNEFFEIEKKIMEARKKYIDELKDILTTRQIAEYIVFERDFMKDLRNVVKDVQKDRQRKE